MLRFVVFVAGLCVGIALAPASPAGERRVTLYPGQCSDGQAWYYIESDDSSVTVGCQDPDYNPPSEEPDHALD